MIEPQTAFAILVPAHAATGGRAEHSAPVDSFSSPRAAFHFPQAIIVEDPDGAGFGGEQLHRLDVRSPVGGRHYFEFFSVPSGDFIVGAGPNDALRIGDEGVDVTARQAAV